MAALGLGRRDRRCGRRGCADGYQTGDGTGSLRQPSPARRRRVAMPAVPAVAPTQVASANRRAADAARSEFTYPDNGRELRLRSDRAGCVRSASAVLSDPPLRGHRLDRASPTSCRTSCSRSRRRRPSLNRRRSIADVDAYTGRCAIDAFCTIALFASLAALCRGKSTRAGSPPTHECLAASRVDFQGSFIYQHDGRTDALRIFHAAGEQERERLISLTGARGEDRPRRPSDHLRAVRRRADAVRESRRIAACCRWCRMSASSAREYSGQHSPAMIASRATMRASSTSRRAIRIATAIACGCRKTISCCCARRCSMPRGGRSSSSCSSRSMSVRGRAKPISCHPAMSPSAVAPVRRSAARVASRSGISSNVPPGFHLVRAQQAVGGVPERRAPYLYRRRSRAFRSTSSRTRFRRRSLSNRRSMHGVLSIHSVDAAGVRVTALGDVPPATVQAMARGVRSAAGGQLTEDRLKTRAIRPAARAGTLRRRIPSNPLLWRDGAPGRCGDRGPYACELSGGLIIGSLPKPDAWRRPRISCAAR